MANPTAQRQARRRSLRLERLAAVVVVGLARLPRRHSPFPGPSTSAVNCWRNTRSPTARGATPSLSGPQVLMGVSAVRGANPSLQDLRARLWPHRRESSWGHAGQMCLASPSALKLPPMRFRGVPARRRAHRKVPARRVATWPPLSVRGRQPAALRRILLLISPLCPPQLAEGFEDEPRKSQTLASSRRSLLDPSPPGDSSPAPPFFALPLVTVLAVGGANPLPPGRCRSRLR